MSLLFVSKSKEISYNMFKFDIQKPFLKWIGGKSQILDKIYDKIPKEINNYHEIFLGGGSVLLLILSMKKSGLLNIKGNVYAYDINNDLIQTYKHIQTNKDDLFDILDNYKKIYDSLSLGIVNRNPETLEDAKTSKESFYYWCRKRYNTIDRKTIECSALFIFLNKTCFRGMYRVGPNGFNVPYGNYKTTPKFISKIELNDISNLIKDVIFICEDFNLSIDRAVKNDLVYLDPPYVPVNDKSFTNYVKNGFTIDQHKKLFKLVNAFKFKQIKFIMNNSDVKIVNDYFKDYQKINLEAKRSINSKNPAQKEKELIIFFI